MASGTWFGETLPTGETLPVRSVDLGGGVEVVEAVAPDGSMMFWLLDPESDRGEWSLRMAPHERCGPLTRAYVEKLGRLCGFTSQYTGRPCRNVVREFGMRCSEHEGAE